MQKYNKTFLGYLEMESSMDGMANKKLFKTYIHRVSDYCDILAEQCSKIELSCVPISISGYNSIS